MQVYAVASHADSPLESQRRTDRKLIDHEQKREVFASIASGGKVRDLKKYLQKLTGISPFRQVLSEEDTARELLDSHSLGLRMVLELLVRPFPSRDATKSSDGLPSMIG